MAEGGKRPVAGPEPSVGELIETCERSLRTPAVDWETTYLRLRLTPVGADFPRDRFLRTPCRTIWELLAFIDHYEQGVTNASSITTARLADYVLQGLHIFSHNPPPKSRPWDFLPYPEWQPEGTNTDGPSESTKFVLGKLLREGRLAFHIFLALNSPRERAS